jgi:3',5'-cyclic AMP phosphodiesterase CpdA
MVTLAHVSDVHIGPLPPISLVETAGKRVFGLINWQRRGQHIFDPTTLAALAADMAREAPDHVAVTGDLVNLGLPAEYGRARAWVSSLGAADHVTLVPGNHDAYVKGAFERALAEWRPYMLGDEAHGPVVFPFVRRRGPLALIGLSTAVPTAPLMATGRLGPAQCEALARVLADLDGAFRVVLIHHPPVDHSRHRHRRLVDAEHFRAAIAASGAELVIHGHDHKPRFAEIPGRNGPVPVVGVRAAADRPRGGKPGGGYNLYRIAGGPGRYACTMVERAVSEPGGPVETVAERRLS